MNEPIARSDPKFGWSLSVYGLRQSGTWQCFCFRFHTLQKGSL